MLKLTKFSKSVAAVVSAILAVAGLTTVPARAATAVINSVAFKAPVNTSYDHNTGGGVWNDGSVTWDKGELQGTDYKCGEWTSYLFELNVNNSPTMTGPYTASVTLTYTRDTTGQSGVSLNPSKDPSHLKVNTGVIYGQNHTTTIGSRTGTGVNGWDGGANALGDQAIVNAAGASITDNGKAEFVSGATQSITFSISNLRAGANVIVRNDAQIHCKAGSSPTGNLQASLSSVSITGPSAESVSAGNQTVNFKGAGGIVGASTPLLQVTKAISTDGASCTSTTPTASFRTGDPILFCYTVYNWGSATASGVTLQDDNAVTTSPRTNIPLTYGSGNPTTSGVTIPGGGAFATGQYLTNYSTAGIYTNIAYAVSTTTGATTAVTASARATVTDPTGPAITITKTQTSAIKYYTQGEVISYSIRVTSTGTDALTNVVVTDANADSGSIVCPDNTLSARSGTYTTWTCTAAHTVTSTDETRGTVTNQARVDALGFTSPFTAVNAVSNTTTTAAGAPVTHPSLSISKTQSSTARVTTTGDRIDYWITVTNDGDVDLTGVAVSDANAVIDSCNPASSSTVAVGASMVCAAHHILTDADVTAGQVDNTADVRTTTSGLLGPIVSNVVTTKVGIPSLTIVKTKTSTNALHVEGDIITYSIVVTNTGSTSLSNVTLTDDNGTLDCGGVSFPATIAIGNNLTCTASHSVTAAEVTAGQTVNTASVTTTSFPNGVNSNTVTTPITPAPPVHVPVPDLSITKALNGTAPSKVGDVITYKIVVTNTGETYLLGVNISDSNATIGACTMVLPTPLAQGESFSCVATHIVTDADMATGKVDNTATATSTNAYLIRYSNLVTVPLTAAPAIQVSKALASAAPAKAGDTIGYTITVKNTGNVTLNSVTVTDANATLGACSVVTPATLAVGASFTCAATHVVTNADFAAGKVDNVAAASGTSVAGTSAGASSSSTLLANSNLVTVPLVAAPALTVVKALNGAAPAKTGDVITYSIMVTNTGNVDLTNVTVTDDNATVGTCTPVAPAALSIGASITCAATHLTTDADFAAGKVDNVAAASGNFGGGNGDVTGNSNLVTVPLTFAPQISVVKQQVGGLPTKLGGFIHYTIAVTNTGNVNLHNVTIVDDNATITDCTMANPAPVLNIGETITCSAKHALTAKDVEAGKVVNVATATSAENATASSNASGSAGSNTGTAGTSDPGSVVVPSNGVVTFIKIAGIRGKFNGTPNGGTVTLGGSALSNPKLKVLAFTGDVDNVVEEGSLFLLLAAGVALILALRRRISR
jgi:uncharacterized repeat protein (TIGR01451 family)